MSTTLDRDAHTPLLLDKSLWLTLLGFLLPIINARFGLGLSAEAVAEALLPLVAFVAASKWKQTAVVKAKVAGEKAAAAAAATVTDAKSAADALGEVR